MKFLIVDDHALLREGLCALLKQFEDNVTVLQAASAEEGLALAETHADLDAVFLDLIMPGQNGQDIIGTLCRRAPQTPIIVLSVSEDPNDVRRALKAGALGYVPKSATPQTMLSALRLVLSGNIYVPPFVVDSAGGDTAQRSKGEILTERQTEVLRQLCLGLTNREISRALALSEKTTKAHITAIFKALGVVNRVQASEAAREAGLLPQPAPEV
jgi:DNA-binding NarL/FixJ family response regulator